MRSIVLPLLAGLALVPAVVAGAAPSGGLRGVVKQTPTAPVCAQDVPCDGLARGVTLVFVRRGLVRARATTHNDGTYSVRLAAGRYGVRLAASDGVATVKPSVVTVRIGRVARVNFVLDTGIRQP